MSERDYLVNQFKMLPDMLKMHLNDFSEADMLARPGETGNHSAWHVGHLAVSYGFLIGTVSPNAIPAFEPAFIERHGKAGSMLNDGFQSKEKLLARFKEANDAAIAWVKSLTPEQMSKKTAEMLQGFAPTVGDLAYVLPPHANMHIGQIQAIRRKLGKPVLF